MPSSTSNSEVRAKARSYTGPIAWTLIAIVLILCGFEASIRIGFSRVSRIESRTFSDHTAALAVRHRADSRPSILLLGNSLLLEGIDYDRLRAGLEPAAMPTRFVIEQTAWLDWYYGIRRLFAEGSRPDRIVLCLNIDQLVSDRLLGDYAAFYLIQTSDLAEAGSAAGYSLTRISSLFFARYSLGFAGLTNFRNFALNKVAPSYGGALHEIRAMARAQGEKNTNVLARAGVRLARLQSLCAEFHTRCDILVPPALVPQGESEESELVEAGKKAGTKILIPVPVNAWGREMYGDGFHLTPAAAVSFTDLVATALLRQ